MEKVHQTLTLRDLASCCPTNPDQQLARESAEDFAVILKAVADPNRLQLLALINSSENNESCVCDLTEPLNLTQPTVSHHLKKLTDAGLLNREKRGTWAWYQINQDAWSKVSSLFS